MQKPLITLALVFALGNITPALSADGTLFFTSKLLDSACIVTPTQHVVLDDMAVGQLPDINSVSPRKEFAIELRNCPPHVQQAQIRFEGAASQYTAYRAFALDDPDSPTTAKGIAFQIENDPQLNIYAAIAPNTLSSTVTLDSTPGNINKLIFTGRYVAVEKEVKAGTANVTTQFSIIYP
ncbi:hypothetical protein Z042_22830 [Chania multitudinisentens RB-25]|uniref:Fimbrial-type adhesion domain-containing protein n=1 Tax=Chania multitudinisentens RB-25 TaxID=1441930 RepID=W0LKX8_9GAMM|nr:fimbrial protein [Chania multitudinisentens]AHG22977.1 hypothetical protein Z042_22830 [Chania multitudinisentens RB-25]